MKMNYFPLHTYTISDDYIFTQRKAYIMQLFFNQFKYIGLHVILQNE